MSKSHPSNHVHVLQGDATLPLAEGPKIIAHVCNDIGGWGSGFVVAVSKRWKEPERAFRAWYRGRADNDFALGSVQFVPVGDDLEVANMIGQHGIKGTSEGPPIRYPALKRALEKVGERAVESGASVHMPRIGCGLAGGDWSKVGPMVESSLGGRGVEVFVYDFVAG